MELYNSTIRELTEKLGGLKTQSWAYEPGRAWKDLGQNELVLGRDAAYELGGGRETPYPCRIAATLVQSQGGGEPRLCYVDRLEGVSAEWRIV